MFLLLNRNPFLLANLVSMSSHGVCCKRGSGRTFTTLMYSFNPFLVTNQQVYNAQANDAGTLLPLSDAYVRNLLCFISINSLSSPQALYGLCYLPNLVREFLSPQEPSPWVQPTLHGFITSGPVSLPHQLYYKSDHAKQTKIPENMISHFNLKQKLNI